MFPRRVGIMAALSLSARDIEERLGAILWRLRMRARLHALGYALGCTLGFSALVVWWDGGQTVATYPTWSLALFLALTVVVASLASALRERGLDGQSVAAWVDREARLKFRLSTFAALGEAPKRSPLFSVLLLQLLQLSSRYQPRNLVPWRPLKPAAAVVAGVLAFALAWTNLPAAPAERKSTPSAAGAKPSLSAVSREQRERIRTNQEHASAVLGENRDQRDASAEAENSFDSEATAEVGDADTGAESGRASDGRGSSGVRSARTGQVPRDATAGEGANEHTAGGVGRGETQGGPVGKVGKAEAKSQPGKFESEQKTDAGPGSSLAAQVEPSRFGQHGEGGPRPSDSRESGPEPSQPRSGQKGAAGSGTDGAGLYGQADATTEVAPGRGAEPLVVQLPVSSVVRGKGQRQGNAARGTQVAEDTLAAGTSSSSESPSLQKPLLPPEYELLARQLFYRSWQP